jgi:Transcription termination factor nusG.
VQNNKIKIGWYALYTAPRAEKVVAKRLSEIGFEAFLPILQLERRWSDRLKIVEMPMFSSYVFVHVRENELNSLLKVSGVVRVVYFCGKPAVIKDSEIESVKKMIDLSGVGCEMVVGDNVEIVLGELSKGKSFVKGKILKIGKVYLSLFIEQLGVKVIIKKSNVLKK